MNVKNKTFLICHDNIVDKYQSHQYTDFLNDYITLLKDFCKRSHAFMPPQAYVTDGNYLLLYHVQDK